MARLSLPYADTHLEFEVPDNRLRAVLRSRLDESPVPAEGREVVANGLANPIGSPRLGALAAAAERVLVITSDHTRPLPSRVTLPPLLADIRGSNPSADVVILVATGYHRPTSRPELEDRFGRELVETERIVVHDCRDRRALSFKGVLPSGGELWLNSLVDWADLVVAEGFIEPHFFAGFSGGRKSVLPGIAGEQTVLANHCAAFIAHPAARTGNLAGNPLHVDMLHAARAAGLRFIHNVVVNSRKEVVASFAGHPEEAHEAGCAWLSERCRVRPVPAPIVMTSNGGYPLDQNIYQAVKGMTAAAATAQPGGVIIMVSACEDGHGGQAFYDWFRDAPGPEDVARRIAFIPREETRPDQWEAQILARILTRHKVILVTDRCDPGLVTGMHMLHASTVEEALRTAESMVGARAPVTVIPDGVSVIVDCEQFPQACGPEPRRAP